MKRAVFVELMDKRYQYVLELLKDEGFLSFALGEEELYPDYQKIYVMSLLFEVNVTLARELESNSYLFCNTLSDEVAKIIAEKNITHINMLKDELFLFKNAYLTSECALHYIIENTASSLIDMPVLVLGYGRVGKSMVKILNSLGAKVDVVTDDVKEGAEVAIFAEVYDTKNFEGKVEKYTAIINTIPKLIIKGETIKQINKDCFLLDLASLPGGIDFEQAKKQGIKCIHALGVPGKLAPKTAGKYIKDVIMKGLQ